MSHKKSIFPENKFGIQSMTPSYSKIKVQPLNETSQQTAAYFLKQNLSQNSNFLKNFKSKHLSSAAPSINSFVETETAVHPFKVFESQDIESSDRSITKVIKINEMLKKDIKTHGPTISFDVIENSEEVTSHKTIHKLNTPFSYCNSLSPSKGGKNYKTMPNQKPSENKENQENKGLEKNQKMKLNFRKHSEVMDEMRPEKEEFSASKNLLHSSVKNLHFFKLFFH